MRIENLRKTKDDGIEKIVATVIYENIARAPADVYFHTSQQYSHFLVLNPNAFLLAGYLSAMYVGEKRIYIQGKIDEKLKKGLLLNMHTFQKWYGRKYKPIPIESGNEDFSQEKSPKLNTGLFFSGGTDSIYSLRANRLKYNPDNPLFIKDCFIVCGFDMYRSTQSNKDLRIFERAVQNAKKITNEAGANLIPVFTNLRHHFNGDELFWPNWHHGAALAAVGHCFISRINSVLIASSHSPSMLGPYGSHPLIDHNYGNSDLKVTHDDLYSPLEKMQLISEWEIGFQNIRSCYQNDENNLNCCRCVKCARVMITLMALGILKKSRAFPIHRLSPELLNEAVRKPKTESYFKGAYLKLVPLLKKHGHQDVAEIILRENGLKSKLRRLDHSNFQGKLKKFINSMTN